MIYIDAEGYKPCKEGKDDCKPQWCKQWETGPTFVFETIPNRWCHQSTCQKADYCPIWKNRWILLWSDLLVYLILCPSSLWCYSDLQSFKRDICLNFFTRFSIKVFYGLLCLNMYKIFSLFSLYFRFQYINLSTNHYRFICITKNLKLLWHVMDDLCKFIWLWDSLTWAPITSTIFLFWRTIHTKFSETTMQLINAYQQKGK